jgi:hypothetical protein
MEQSQKFREYDGLIGLTLHNLVSLSYETQKIRLLGFDRKNKEHLFVLRVAYFARDLYHYPIEIDSSWWNTFCLNWKHRKGFNRVKRIDDGNYGVPTVDEILNKMRVDGIQRIGENFSFADIYEEYYEGKK